MRNRRADFLVLAFDIGSSSTRTAFFDSQARRLETTSASVPYLVNYTTDGGAELSPIVLRRAAARCLTETLRRYHASPSLRKIPVTAVSASSLWHGLLGLDARRSPITPVFTWADARATDDAARLREELSEKQIHARTGGMLRSTFWPAKLRWLRRTQPGLFQRAAWWVSPADWILHELFGNLKSSGKDSPFCSESMASATGLFNLKSRTWDNELCKICRVDLGRLSRIIVSGSAERRSLTHARIFPAIGDGAAGNLGSGAGRPGIVAINIGTSAAVRMTQTKSQSARMKVPLGLFRYAIDAERSVMGGAVSNAGNLRAWCLRELRWPDANVDRALSRTAAANDALTVLPFWVHERAPTWPDQQLGVIDGLNQATRAPDILRATMTAVFYRLAEILDLMEAAAGRARRIVLSGGILHSLAAVKILADALGRDLEIARDAEASLRGAAIYALNQMEQGAALSRAPSRKFGGWKPPLLGFAMKAESKNKVIKYDRALAAKHRRRRQRQFDLEKILTTKRL